MSVARRQIFAFSGMLPTESDRRTNFDLTRHALSLCATQERQKVCYLPTAVGDSQQHVEAKRAMFERECPDVVFSALRLFPQPDVESIREHLLAQDLVLVEGGSVVNLTAVWRAHGLHETLRECWEAGVVLAGGSAGSLCWHVGGPTDSYGGSVDLFTGGIGLLPWSNGVHDDFEDQPRRELYRRWVGKGSLPDGYAVEDGVGLHYVGTDLHEAVTIRPGTRAWLVRRACGDDYTEEEIIPREL